MNDKIFIPKKCKVGFQERNDTYTKKLGYIIYHDGKIWRKEKSWSGWITTIISSQEYENQKRKQFDYDIDNCKRSWSYIKQNPHGYNIQYKDMSFEDYLKDRHMDNYDTYDYHSGNTTKDESFTPVEFDNVSTSGFVLNRKAGGDRYGWNPRQTYCRVYDPRGFEFEITIPNLLYILENTSSIKGKGLDGNFIYGWSGTELILIPENAPEFQQMVSFTNLQNMPPLSTKTLKPGFMYTLKDGSIKTYIGHSLLYDYYGVSTDKKVRWFMNDQGYVSHNDGKNVRVELSLNPDFANLVSKIKDSSYVGTNKTFTKLVSFGNIRNKAVYMKIGKTYERISIWSASGYGRSQDYGFTHPKDKHQTGTEKQLLAKYEFYELI